MKSIVKKTIVILSNTTNVAILTLIFGIFTLFFVTPGSSVGVGFGESGSSYVFLKDSGVETLSKGNTLFLFSVELLLINMSIKM
ncbi:hypothetical protein MAR_005826 [Mya arenaria]|uniref:Uncharacterized protein n=1 Tax=Mya arenaria TaxID=6604 RepID=A0ABY7F3U5_MYAAR|nr:hypothetical protein MAR_005826 [Mya arenaria]